MKALRATAAAALAVALVGVTLSWTSAGADPQAEYPSSADATTATTLRLTGPGPQPAGAQLTLGAQLTVTRGGSPVAGQPVQLWSGAPRDGVPDTLLIARATSPDGTVHFPVIADPNPASSRYYLSYPGDRILLATTSTGYTVPVEHTRARAVVTMQAPGTGNLTRPVPVTAHLADAGGDPVAAQTVSFERRSGSGTWVQAATARTNGTGTATGTVRVTGRRNLYRAVVSTHPIDFGTVTLLAATSHPVRVHGVPSASVLSLAGPGSVIDEKTIGLTTTWSAAGAPVTGKVVLQSHTAHTGWSVAATAQTNRRGHVTFTLEPRVNTSYRVTSPAGSWYTSATSATHSVTNVPPGTVVRLPVGAPSPQDLPPVQPRGTGVGANPVITALPDAVWDNMVGKTWHPGCPVGRAQLSYIQINYWGFDGYRHRGELVINAAVAGRVAAAFTDLYEHRVPIRSMYLVDRWGYSPKTHGGDDYAAMMADNTSGFNCRDVDGRPGVLSPHATGRAIDINTFENPYHTVTGQWVPNSWWHTHTLPLATWRSATDLVPTLLAAHGIRWTYGMKDSQHFDS